MEWVAMGVCVILILRRAHNLLVRNETYRLDNTRGMGVERMILFLWIRQVYILFYIYCKEIIYRLCIVCSPTKIQGDNRPIHLTVPALLPSPWSWHLLLSPGWLARMCRCLRTGGRWLYCHRT